jgi:anthranilate synthase component 2
MTNKHILDLEAIQNEQSKIAKSLNFSKINLKEVNLEIEGKQIYGVQFHPESIMSEYGYEMIDNFLKL